MKICSSRYDLEMGILGDTWGGSVITPQHERGLRTDTNPLHYPLLPRERGFPSKTRVVLPGRY